MKSRFCVSAFYPHLYPQYYHLAKKILWGILRKKVVEAEQRVASAELFLKEEQEEIKMPVVMGAMMMIMIRCPWFNAEWKSQFFSSFSCCYSEKGGKMRKVTL